MKLRFPEDRNTSRERSLHLTRIRNYDHSEYMNWVIDVNKNPDLVKSKSFLKNQKDTEQEKEWKDKINQMVFVKSEATVRAGGGKKTNESKEKKKTTQMRKEQ